VDTQESSRELFRFIILIPHRDALRPFNAYREKLFSNGFYGAYSFPLSAPLAAVSSSFKREELKDLGRNIRNRTIENGGKITSKFIARTAFNGKSDFFGPVLNLKIDEGIFPQPARAKILNIIFPPILCASLINREEEPVHEEIPAISFRAASFANLVIRPLDSGEHGYSFEWRVGPQVWLPKL